MLARYIAGRELTVGILEDRPLAVGEIIPATGSEGRGEALEHLLEHLILRKQDQADFLRRALAGT